MGKGEYKSVFIRNEGDNDIYTEDTDLRQEAGIYGADKPAKPEPGTWLNKDVLKMEDTGAITKLALTYPDKAVVFEKREKPKPEEEKAADKPEAEGEDGEDTVEVPDADVPPEYEWVLASGGPGGAHKAVGPGFAAAQVRESHRERCRRSRQEGRVGVLNRPVSDARSRSKARTTS